LTSAGDKAVRPCPLGNAHAAGALQTASDHVIPAKRSAERESSRKGERAAGFPLSLRSAGMTMGEARTAGRRAVVIGGSVGGLFIANMLLRKGWQVDVFERVGEGLASRGLGIARHGELLPILAAAGVREAGPPGIAVTGRSAFDKSGKVIARFDYPQHLGAWSGVFNPLLAAFPAERYHLGRELVGIDRRGNKVVASFADGAGVETDLIIGADGFRSTVRALCAPQVRPSYAGYVAWRGIMEERDLSAEFRAHTFDQFAFCFPLRSQFIGYPVPGADESVERSRRRYSFLWYYPVAAGEELTDVLTDASGRTHEHSIPPPLIRPVHIRRLKENAMALLPPQFAEVVVRSERHMVQPIYDVESTRMVFDRVALLGDAAFVARPHVGVGVLKAGEDAFELARCLAESPSIDAALGRYQAARLPVARDTVRLGRRLGAFIERGLEGPWSDPDLGLVPQTIVRISARPVAHLEPADLGPTSDEHRRRSGSSMPV
jgi:2-polyprenyl-6-methoxyphenol hydroxylase-like FAD-dependent oxidoreductase